MDRKVGTVKWPVGVNISVPLRRDVPETKWAASPGGPLWLGTGEGAKPLLGMQTTVPARILCSASEQEPSSTQLHTEGHRRVQVTVWSRGSERLLHAEEQPVRGAPLPRAWPPLGSCPPILKGALSSPRAERL